MLGPTTEVINGQRMAIPQSYMIAPAGYGPQTQGTPLSAPTIPPVVGNSGNGAAANNFGLGGLTGQNAVNIQASPFSPKHSPLLWAVGGLLFAWLMLTKVHYRSVATEKASVLGAKEEASV